VHTHGLCTWTDVHCMLFLEVWTEMHNAHKHYTGYICLHDMTLSLPWFVCAYVSFLLMQWAFFEANKREQIDQQRQAVREQRLSMMMQGQNLHPRGPLVDQTSRSSKQGGTCQSIIVPSVSTAAKIRILKVMVHCRRVTYLKDLRLWQTGVIPITDMDRLHHARAMIKSHDKNDLRRLHASCIPQLNLCLDEDTIEAMLEELNNNRTQKPF